MYPSFSDIIYFIEVAQTLNISRAAERLGISQPSLSIALKRLEDILDTPLLVRTKSGVQLTKAGQSFLMQAKELQQKWNSIKASINASSDSVVGHYKLGCHVSVAQYTLPHFLPTLLKSHPNLHFQLQHDLSRKICEKVISFELDFGIVVNPVPHPDLVIKQLCNDKVTFWVSSKTPKENLNTLICDTNLAQSQDLIQKLKKKKLSFQRVLSSTSLEVIASLTAAGTGVGLLPTKVAEQNKSHKLKLYDESFPVYNDTICLVTRVDLPKNFATKQISESITSSFKS